MDAHGIDRYIRYFDAADSTPERGHGTDSEFHATTDAQAVRDRVFGVLQAHDFRIDATVLEKAKANPHTRSTEERFYKLAWWLHMKHVAPRVVRVVRACDELFVVGASLE